MEAQIEDATTAPPDHEHYVENQMRPIADAVLRSSVDRISTTRAACARSLSLFR
jgi:hypothetical protein